jgi:tryptophan synthase alpha chain
LTNRIDRKFAALAAAKRKGLITFIMGGDPNLKSSSSLLKALPAAGADIIEIGMPFSDPMADGPVIQAAGLRALKAGTKLKNIIVLVREFRAKDKETPIILMGYYNPIYHYGIAKFCKDATKAGVDGVILVDLPPEEEDEFTSVATPQGIHLIRLIAPTTDDARLALLNHNAGGFLYYISITGITGTRSANAGDLKASVRNLKSKSELPVAIGFGIKTPRQAAEAAAIADAVVVGSELVKEGLKGKTAMMTYVRSLKAAIDGRK